jgi:hypothetical protein
MERTVNELIAAHPEITRVVIHLGGLGRVDLTGALMLRDVVDQTRAAGVEVEVSEVGKHAGRILARVLGATTYVGTSDDQPDVPPADPGHTPQVFRLWEAQHAQQRDAVDEDR